MAIAQRLADIRAEMKIELPPAERGRGDHEVKRLERLNARLARPDLTSKQREAAIREREALERAPGEIAEKAWRDATAAETAALAKGRGEDVTHTKSGVVRVNSRDALLSLLRTGRLTTEQYDAGVTCRDDYEARSRGLGSQMGDLGRVGGSSNDNSGAIFAGVQRAKSLQRIGRIERAIAMEARDDLGRLDPNALKMLRAVCDEGKSLSSQGEGRAFERNAKSLATALTVAGENLR